MARPLRVTVVADLAAYPKLSATERMWREVIDHLGRADGITLTQQAVPSSSRWRRPPDVVVYDGHQGRLDMGGHHVVHVQEAAWDEPELQPYFEPWFLERFTEPTRDALRRATRVIVPSTSSARQVVHFAGIPESQVTVTPHGVDLAVFKPDGDIDGAEVLRRHNALPDGPYVLFVSTLHPRKNLPALRAAMAGLARRGFPHALVLVAAAAADRDSTQLQAAAVADLGGGAPPVRWLAGISDVELAAVMRGADVFCLPSLMEGFGLTALEAMACGVPVVVSDRGSLPEVVGDAAVVVAPDAESVEAGLVSVLDDPALAKDLAERGAQRATGFSWEHGVRGWSDAVRQAAAVS
jgi:glycosyltransferase involved in cell wall biosynthesis